MSFGDHDILANIAKFTGAVDQDPALSDGGRGEPPIQNDEQQYNAERANSAAAPIEEQPPTDFTGQQGAMPMDAGAPQPQGAQPAPQAPQQVATPNLQQTPVQNLSPEAAMNAYQQNNANAQGVMTQETANKNQAAADQSAVTQQQNDIKAQALPYLNQVDQDHLNTRMAIDQSHQLYTQQAIANSQDLVSKYEQEAQKDPHSFWGGTSVAGKIGGIIGMVGAGLAHKDAAGYIQNIVNNNVAAAQRKEHFLGKIGRQQDYTNNLESQGYATDVASIDARKAAVYKLINNQVEQRLAQTANPMEQAKLKELIASNNMELAKNFQASADKQVHAAFEADKIKIQQQLADSDMLTAQTHALNARTNTKDSDMAITDKAMKAVRGVPSITKIDQRLGQMRPALDLLRSNPNASSAQLDQILLQILNGEVGGRVSEGMLGHLKPQSYMQKFKEAQERLTNNPQDAEAKAFMDRTAHIVEQTISNLEYEKRAERHNILKPLSPYMGDDLRKNLDYSDEEPKAPTPELTSQERAQQILNKYPSAK